jgi:phosphoglucosamine mutase
MIFREFATTGDGMLTALQILETSVLEKASLDELAAGLTVYPQLLVNVRVTERKPLDQLPRVQDMIRECETALAGTGRVLVRFSGTEPLARVMVEAQDVTAVENWAHRIAATIRLELT